jgi:hypothetical protein
LRRNSRRFEWSKLKLVDVQEVEAGSYALDLDTSAEELARTRWRIQSPGSALIPLQDQRERSFEVTLRRIVIAWSLRRDIDCAG